MKTILNIGRDIGDHPNALSLREILGAVIGFGIKVDALRVIDIDGAEGCVVVESSDADSCNLYGLAALLGQDCIAVYDPIAREGTLIGPKAGAWGEFNPAYFWDINGRVLAPPVAVAA